MKFKFFNLLAIGVLFLATSCNLTATPTPTEIGTSDGTTPTEEPADFEDEIDLPPADYMDILNDKIDSGEWTREEGLITLLELFAGETSLDETGVDTSTLLETEGTGIVALSVEYLRDGSDEAAKAEITRLLNLLFPTPEMLLRYSQEGTGQSGASQKVAAPRGQAPDCAGLWRDGFPDDRTPSFPCFLANTQNIGGNTYQVFFPAAWAGDASKAPYYEMTRQAIADSVPVMQRYGQMRPIYFVFTYLNDEVYPMTTLAMTAWEDFQPGMEACPVFIYPNSLSLGDAAYMQTIAHEIFHCFTAFNLRNQGIGAGYESSDWWVEGAAEYFSNLVYPSADYEYRFLSAFNSNSLSRPLTSMTYENFIFFQYLGNRLGPEGVIEFLHTMPTEAGKDKQLAALAAFPEMGNLFEHFAQDFVDNRVRDTSGAIKPYMPQFVDVGTLTTGGADYKAFVLRRYKAVLSQGNNFTISAPGQPGDVRVQLRPSIAPGFWQPLPFNTDAACNNIEYVFYIIGTDSVADRRTIQLQVDQQPAVCTAGCLVGTWQLDNSSYLNYLEGFLSSTEAGSPTVDWVEGAAYLIFDDHGSSLGEYHDFMVQMTLHTMENILDEEVTPEMRVTMNGSSSATYTATNTTITTTAVSGATDFEFSAQVYVQGMPVDMPVTIPFDENTFAGAPNSGSTEYLCMGDLLFLEVPVSGNPVLVYTRLP